MAEAKLEILVEKVVLHDLLVKLAQQVWDKYGLRMDSISFTWVNASAGGKTDFQVEGALVQSWAEKGEPQ